MLHRARRLAAGPAKETLLKKAEEAEAKALWARSKAAQLARLALASPPPEGPVTPLPQPVTSSASPLTLGNLDRVPCHKGCCR